MHKSRKTVGVILTANSTIEPYSENILEWQRKEQEAQLMSEDSCILEPEMSVEDKLGMLIARGLVIPASSMPIRVLNVSNKRVNLKAKMKVEDLIPIETNKQQLCLTMITEDQKSNIFGNRRQLFERRSINANNKQKRKAR